MSGSVPKSVILRKTLFIGFCAGICALHLVASQSPQRIRSEIKDSERFALSGNVRPAIVNAKDQGEVSGSLALPAMTMHFAMSASQKADLQQLLQQQQTRHSTQYHKWLTPEQYADRFGLNEKDMERVKAWLESQGFTNVQAARGRSFITFSGTADQAQQAFHTSIHHYLTADGQTHFANSTEPELPNALNGMVESIRGLHNFRMKPHSHPRLTSSATGNHFLVPDDWATIYDVKPLYNSGFNGAGHSIAIPGQTDLVMSDIETFQTNIGLPVKDPQVIVTGTDPGVQAFSGDLGESDLDIEWASGLAPGASIIFVTSQSVVDAETFIVDNNVADVMSITYGLCEAQYGRADTLSLNTLFQQAVAQGMTVVAASGDEGAADCDSGSSLSYVTQGLSVDVPSSLPYVTGVGGTEFNEGIGTGATSYWSNSNNSSNGSALSYFPEISWNDSANDGSPAASGGGVSTIFAKPSWQTGTGVPNNSFRNVPDLALDASADHDGYLTCSETQLTSTSPLVPTCVDGLRLASTAAQCAAENPPLTSPCGTFNVSGGTSASAPAFAAMIAILNQQTGQRQGFINPNLYTLASISSNAFHDITSGNNIVACQGGSPNCSSTVAAVQGTLGYSAGVGYDLVTGWGSIDAYNFVTEWNDDFQMTSSPTSLTINPSSSGTATINVSPHGSFTGTVTFTCSVASTLTATTCSVPGTVSNGSGSVTLTVTAGAGAKTPWWKRTPKFPNSSLPLLLAALLLAACVSFMTKQRKLQLAGFAFTVLFLAGGLTSCGGGSSSTSTLSGSGTTTTTTTPSVTGNVTVTGTSGTLSNSITIAVTIP
jgi:subtilase family serine protease